MTFLMIATHCLLIFLLYREHKKASLLSDREQKTAAELRDANEALTSARLEVDLLAPFRAITDAQAEASRIADDSKEALKASRDRADSILTTAQKNADSLIATAEQEAKKIAGAAYEALKKADALESTAAAMKNIIEGYGDRYLVPTYSLLDRLADDYSHTQAGTELKQAREKTKSMIKSSSGADCDYVETNRKQTAIEFVLDAFNGKVDTILASVKEDNFGTLERKIQDAFHTVNHNGAAFRNARITELYLATRISELKWACITHALKEREKEEQRSIREQMREEEKAAREIEKALRDAQKEEESITKSMDKVRKDLESAGEAQKAKYEEKLAELTLRLAEAEANNQRALSMAQQTKRGHVYIISNIGSFGDQVLKIGMTRRLDPMDRVWELGDASVPFDFDVHAMILTEDAPNLEKALHEKFRDTSINKINPRKEFFKLQIHDVRAEIEQLGIQAKWTMKADAMEYRESQAATKTKNAA